MAQLDRLLAAMVSNKADSLVLEDGDFVKVEVAGQLRPLTKTALTGQQIVALLKEIASADAQKLLDASKPATIAYSTGDGAFVVRAMINGAKWHVVAKIDDHAEFKRRTGQFKQMNLPPETPEGASAQPPAPPPAQAPPASALPAATGSSQSDQDVIAPFEGSVQAQAYIDQLLRALVEKGASDLHLRVTEPPIFRHHGEMVRQEGERLTDEQVF